MRNFLTFNGENLMNYGLYCNGHDTYKGSTLSVEKYAVSGKNGDLIISNDRYSNVTVSYKCFVVENMKLNVRELRRILKQDNYYVLEDTYNPDEFRLGRYIGEFDPEIKERHEAAEFILEFDCRPERFLKSGENWMDKNGTLHLDDAELPTYTPLIRLKGNSLTVTTPRETWNVTVNSSPFPYIDIDTEIMECYYGDYNANPYVDIVGTRGTEEFITFGGGTTVTGSFSVKPRWWRE